MCVAFSLALKRSMCIRCPSGPRNSTSFQTPQTPSQAPPATCPLCGIIRRNRRIQPGPAFVRRQPSKTHSHLHPHPLQIPMNQRATAGGLSPSSYLRAHAMATDGLTASLTPSSAGHVPTHHAGGGAGCDAATAHPAAHQTAATTTPGHKETHSPSLATATIEGVRAPNTTCGPHPPQQRQRLPRRSPRGARAYPPAACVCLLPAYHQAGGVLALCPR